MRRARIKRGMARSDMAEAIRVTTRYCRCLEAGILLPSITKLARLQDCLGFDTNQLLRILIHTVRPFAEFGRLLAAARKRQSLAQAKIAEVAQCAAERYERIEHGRELPTTMVLVRLQGILGLDVDTALQTISVETEATGER